MTKRKTVFNGSSPSVSLERINPLPVDDITCPKCGASFQLTEALGAQIAETLESALAARITEVQHEAMRKEREHLRGQVDAARQEASDARLALDLARGRELTLLRREKDVEDRERTAELEVARVLAQERESIRQGEEVRLREVFGREGNLLRASLNETQARLKAAEKAEVAFHLKLADLENRERGLALEIQRKIDEERRGLVDNALRGAEQRHAAEVQKKVTEIQRLTEQINALRASASVASELHGESLEVVIRDRLRQCFPCDEVLDVARGRRGADIIQVVRTFAQQQTGLLLWEAKNARAWQPAWLEKLREDQVRAKADIAVLVSTTLPPGIDGFGERDGIWITAPSGVVGLATALRHLLLRVANERTARECRAAHLQDLFAYLTGTEFRLHAQAVIGALRGMTVDIDSEQRAFTRIWARRRRQIEQLGASALSMLGGFDAVPGTAIADGGIAMLEGISDPSASDEQPDCDANIQREELTQEL